MRARRRCSSTSPSSSSSGRCTTRAGRRTTTGSARRCAEEIAMNPHAIRDQVAIVGMGCSKFGENWDKDPQDMIVEAAYEAYEDAGLEDPHKQIEAVFCGAQYPAKGPAAVADALQMYDRPVSIVVKSHHNGTLAPKSMLKREITVDDVLKARIISWPFGLYDCAAQSDGAAAAIITRRELAKRFRDDHVLVRAIAIALAPDPKEDPDFDFLRWKPTVYAARQAYEQAGMRDPRNALHPAQVHDCFTPTEPLAYEDLGLCQKGAAKEHIKSGTFELGGELPVNTDGGLKTFGHPTGATGVRMIYENYKQLQGKAEKRQVKGKPTVALSHNIGGAPQACGICIVALP